MDVHYHATQIVKKLVLAGYTAYFAGGWVRDFVMKHPSSDIDIATDAPPEKILDLFPKTILVGLAFGVVIVVIEGHQYEVSTFRRDILYENGRKPTEIEFSNAREDALRRDFTINGMFYDPLEERIIDYVGGLDDIKKGVIRTIGDPQERFTEDRLRMIRAVRFATRFGFHIDLDTQQAIIENADTLFPPVAMERIWQEFNKMAAYPHFDHAIIEMHRLGLLPVIFRQLEKKHLNEIKHLVAIYPAFPTPCPTILLLMELFPDASVKEQVEICYYLRLSGQEIKLVEYTNHLRTMIAQEMHHLKAPDFHAWALAFTHPKALTCIQAIAARYTGKERDMLLHKLAERHDRLAPHIARLLDKRPLVSAALLQTHGINPGKHMGALLKEAERIAIIEHLHDPEAIISQLKQTPLWVQEGKNG